MKRKVLLMLSLSTLAGSVLADRKEELMHIQFRQMAEECQQAIDGRPGYELPAKAPTNLAECYAHKVRVSFQEAKSHHDLRGRFEGSYLTLPRMAYGQDRARLLRAALRADSILVTAAYDGALRGRINPVVAYTVASAALPSAQQSFASRAIASGADPSKVAEATAAGARE